MRHCGSVPKIRRKLVGCQHQRRGTAETRLQDADGHPVDRLADEVPGPDRPHPVPKIVQRGRDQVRGPDRPRLEQRRPHDQERGADVDAEPGGDARGQRHPERLARRGRHRPASRQDRDDVRRDHVPLEVGRQVAHRPEHRLRRGLFDPVAEIRGPVVLAGLAPALGASPLSIVHGRRVTGGPHRAITAALPGRLSGVPSGRPGRNQRGAGSHDPAPAERDDGSGASGGRSIGRSTSEIPWTMLLPASMLRLLFTTHGLTSFGVLVPEHQRC